MKNPIVACCIFVLLAGFTKTMAQKSIKVKGGMMTYNQNQIAVNSFRIATFEVTNDQYVTFLNKNKIDSTGIFNNKALLKTHSPDLQIVFQNKKWIVKPHKKKFPMVMVSYFGAVAYCTWKGGRLPTEIEWMYAASGGQNSKHYKYAGSNNALEVAWYHNNSDAHSHQVGTKKPNELGIYDMSGNAWEWCLNESIQTNENFCIHKGGSWYAQMQASTIVSHYGNTPLHFSNSVGFRFLLPLSNNDKPYISTFRL